jgi:hypothetical protein
LDVVHRKPAQLPRVILAPSRAKAFDSYSIRRRGKDMIATDKVGSRTGYATFYSEHSLGVTWSPDKIVTLRPELRFDHSYDVPAFNNGTRKNQLTFSMDFIIHF